MALNWTLETTYPTPQRGAWALAIDNSDRLYVVAGYNNDTFTPMARVDRYDPSTQTWDNPAQLPTTVDAPAHASDSQGRIYIVSGFISGEAGMTRVVQRYDPATNSWTNRAQIPANRGNAEAVADSQDRIYVTGGYSDDEGTYSKRCYRYDPSTNSWSRLADMPISRRSHAMAVDDQDRIYAIGGSDSNSNRVRRVDRYDPSSNSWTQISQLPSPGRDAANGPSDSWGRIYVAGGTEDGTADGIRDVDRYDPFLSAWESLDPIPMDPGGLSNSIRSVIDSLDRLWIQSYVNDDRDLYHAQTNDTPNAPTLDSPTENEVINTDVSNRFEWTFNDPDPEDTQSQYELRYRVVGTSTWTTVSATTSDTFRDFPDATFTEDDYEWQVRTQDSFGAQGPWSTSEFFTVDSTPATPTIDDPTLDQSIGTNSYEVAWSATEQDAYQLRKVADDGAGNPDTSNVLYDTGTQVSTNTIHETPFPTNQTTEHIQVRVRSNTLWSAWDSVRVSVDYTTPAEPTVTLTRKKEQAHILVEVSHPTPSGNEPNVVSQDLLRRRTGESAWTVLAAGQTPGESYEDYTVVSEQSYEYAIVSYGDNDTSATSVPHETSGLVLKGSWVHRVSDPGASLYQFRYNTSGGSDQWEPDVTFSQFAGRRLPVAEFGEFEDSSVSVDLQLDTEEDVDAFTRLVKSKEILCYRDSARRKVFGIATGFRKNHTFYGGTAPLNIQEIDFTEDVS